MPGSGCHEASAVDNPTCERCSVFQYTARTPAWRNVSVWPKDRTRCTARAQRRLTNRIALRRGALAPSKGRRKQGSAHCPQESADGCCYDPGRPGLFWPPRQGTKLRPRARAPPTCLASALSSTLNAPDITRSRTRRPSFARVPLLSWFHLGPDELVQV